MNLDGAMSTDTTDDQPDAACGGSGGSVSVTDAPAPIPCVTSNDQSSDCGSAPAEPDPCLGYNIAGCVGMFLSPFDIGFTVSVAAKTPGETASNGGEYAVNCSGFSPGGCTFETDQTVSIGPIGTNLDGTTSFEIGTGNGVASTLSVNPNGGQGKTVLSVTIPTPGGGVEVSAGYYINISCMAGN